MTRLPKLAKFDRIEIVWEDAQVTDGGLNVEMFLKEFTVCVRKTLGYYVGTRGNTVLIAETDDRLAGNWFNVHQDVERINAIPVGMITKINVLN
jgi:hypothetical protein